MTKRIAGLTVTLSAICLVAAACGGGAESSTPAATATPAAGATVMMAANPTLGSILVDSGRTTLYVFGADTPGVSNCSGACLQNWPALTVSGNPVAGSGVTGTLGTITRSDGVKQVTLDGMPLYTFALDVKPGDANGQGVNAFGGVWTVAGGGGGTTPTPTRTPSAPFGY